MSERAEPYRALTLVQLAGCLRTAEEPTRWRLVAEFPPEHLLAMKVLAARVKDIDDITFLTSRLGLMSSAAVLAACAVVFSDEPIPERARAILRDLFGES